MKTEVRNAAELAAWLALPGPAVIQDLDLTAASAEIAKLDLAGCAILGFVMAPDLAKAAGETHCLVLPLNEASDEAPFNPYSVSMYTPGELYDGFDPDGTYDTLRQSCGPAASGVPGIEVAGFGKGLRRLRAHHRQHARRDRFHRQPPADQGFVVQGGRSARDDQRKRERA